MLVKSYLAGLATLLNDVGLDSRKLDIRSLKAAGTTRRKSRRVRDEKLDREPRHRTSPRDLQQPTSSTQLIGCRFESDGLNSIFRLSTSRVFGIASNVKNPRAPAPGPVLPSSLPQRDN